MLVPDNNPQSSFPWEFGHWLSAGVELEPGPEEPVDVVGTAPDPAELTEMVLL